MEGWDIRALKVVSTNLHTRELQVHSAKTDQVMLIKNMFYKHAGILSSHLPACNYLSSFCSAPIRQPRHIILLQPAASLKARI